MQICAWISAFMGMFSKGGNRKVKLSDFVLDFGSGKGQKEHRQSAEEAKAYLRAAGMRIPGGKANEEARAAPGEGPKKGAAKRNRRRG
jgi:hypothetical protein